MKLLSLYNLLFNKYGPQNWWPADSKYEVMLGAILTQSTNWKNVEKSIKNLKEKELLSPAKILEIEDEKLMELIRPSGFVRRKSKTIKLLTKKILELDKTKDLYNLRKSLLEIKGIGKETADSIILYAYEMPIFVIDEYTRRFVRRFFNIEYKEYDEYREFFESKLPKNVSLYKEYHALIVEWAKNFSKLPKEKDIFYLAINEKNCNKFKK